MKFNIVGKAPELRTENVPGETSKDILTAQRSRWGQQLTWWWWWGG